MNIQSVGGEPSHRLLGRFVRAQEISHIHQQPEVGMRHPVYQPFHPAALLTEGAVIFHHRPNPFGGGIVGHPAAALDEDRQRLLKSPETASLRDSPGRIVPQPRRS